VHRLRPAVFLDQDGVIVVPQFRDRRSFAPRRLEDFRLYPEAAHPEAAASLHLLVIVTNPPDVGNGLTPRSGVGAMHEINTRIAFRCGQGLLLSAGRQLRLPGMILEGARGTRHCPQRRFRSG
jgi:hypothetical protein